VTLPCQHVYCEVCLHHILLSSAGPHFSPLRCMADQKDDESGTSLPCYAVIPYEVIRSLLSPDEERKLLEFSLLSYCRDHSDEFHFCPTPDCPVVYRQCEGAIALRCPSCHIHICPSCRVEYHEGLSCVEYQDL
jgi:IBR domain, a half RING-finger domain